MLQFVLGFTLAMGVGSVALIALAMAVGSDRISSAIADARAPEPPEPGAEPTSATPAPPKPPADALHAPEVEPPPPPAPAEPAPRHHGRSHAHSDARTADPSVSADEAPSFGRIQVVAVPFGDVELDGRPVGRAPVTTTVEAGRHLVVVSNGGARVERHVVVEPGGTQRVVIDLLAMH